MFFTNDEIKILLQLSSIIITVILALLAYLGWSNKQKRLRESQVAQNVIQAQIALRLTVFTSTEIIFNTIEVCTDDNKSNIIEMISTYRKSFEEKYIDLMQKLSICQSLRFDKIDSIINGYETNYSSLQSVVSSLLTDKVLKEKSIDDEKNTFYNIVNNMKEVENNSDAVNAHLI